MEIASVQVNRRARPRSSPVDSARFQQVRRAAVNMKLVRFRRDDQRMMERTDLRSAPKPLKKRGVPFVRNEISLNEDGHA